MKAGTRCPGSLQNTHIYIYSICVYVCAFFFAFLCHNQKSVTVWILFLFLFYQGFGINMISICGTVYVKILLYPW